jgi:hypothetical protein
MGTCNLFLDTTVRSNESTGMSGVINQNFDGDKTLAKYKENSKGTVTKQPSDDVLKSQGGWIQPNKPL